MEAEDEDLVEDQAFIAGVNDVDHEMMDTLFDLSAYMSDDDDDDDESDGMALGELDNALYVVASPY